MSDIIYLIGYPQNIKYVFSFLELLCKTLEIVSFLFLKTTFMHFLCNQQLYKCVFVCIHARYVISILSNSLTCVARIVTLLHVIMCNLLTET